MRIGAFLTLVMMLVAASDLAAQAQPPQAAPTPTRFFFRESSFEIPFAAQAGVAEVRLYVSADRGNSWQLHSRQAPTAGKFIFQTVRDGEYLFASQSVPDASLPVLVKPERVEQVIVIDTTKPRLDFRSEVTPDGTVTTTFQAIDANLIPQSLRFEHTDASGETFAAIDAQPVIKEQEGGGLLGTITWRPTTSARAINVRISAADAAKNQIVVNRRIFLPRSSLQRLPASVASAPPSIPTDPFNQYQATPSAEFKPVSNGTTAPNANAGTENIPTENSPNVSQLPAVGEGTPAVNEGTPGVTENLASRDQQAASGNSWTAPQQYAPVANEYRPTIPEASSPGSQPQGFNPGMLPAGEEINMTKSVRFSLDYDLDTVGPAGVASVELWTTTDGGKSWQNWGRDPDNQSPFYVEVDKEGVYGFRMVIHGNNLLASAPPKSGDLADIWIGVDTTTPQARITSAQYGEGQQTGSLVIRWEAFDAALGELPIKLKYSASPDGPWNTIAAALANTGEFVWKADPNLPAEIFLRLEALDRAGNVAIYQPAEPISVRGLTPQGRIRGFRAVDDPAP
ncbi:MAG: hypothetical protein CL681_25990 [Blastopirellula sp.]|nr:hypothetical protein [Blastopirellula sp.]